MNKQTAARPANPDYLSVIHKAAPGHRIAPDSLGDAILQTDLAFNITGWNMAAEILHGQPGAMGKNIFQLVDIDFRNGSLVNLQEDLATNHCWSGEIVFTRYDGQQYFFRTTATYIIDEQETPVAILFVNHNINELKEKELKLEEAQKKYEKLMNTLPQGVMMINAAGEIEACNKRGAEMFGLSEDQLLGTTLSLPTWKTLRADGSIFPFSEFPAIVSLQTGFPQRNVVLGIERENQPVVWISVNSEALIHPGKFEPYAAVVSFTDITESRKTEEELRKSNERFYHVSKVTSDAIWDIDLSTKEIYRSGAFRRLSGYPPEDIGANLDWWFSKVHPDDAVRVRSKLNNHIEKGFERWEDQYRFLCADGNYKYLQDSGIILYKHGKPVRIMGAIKDLTEQKELEKRLLLEQEERHKAITQATIAAQEREKANISRELHDNVNQILMSTKLFIDTARRIPEQSDELLDKAIEYQLLALQEIRKISKSLSTASVRNVSIRESVGDIVNNMKLVQDLEVEFIINERVEEKLLEDQKLMLVRIIQEQTNNIIKYASATTVHILLNESNNILRLVITDNGVGFDPKASTQKGIGFMNIISRADFYNGKVNIISSPGYGCTLEVCLPIV